METLSQSAGGNDRLVRYVDSSGPSLEPRWDRVAHEGIARRHGARLYRLARHLTANDSDARDLVQDTYEASLRKLPAGLPQDRIWAWLTATLRNRFVDQKRYLDSRERLAQKQTALFSVPSQEPDTQPRWTRVEPEALGRCVQRLNPVLREVFLLRVRDRRSYADVSALLGIPVSTVGTRYSRALKHLRHMLENETSCSDAATPPAREHSAAPFQ